MTHCPRPLDPIDAEALASGVEPPLAPDAAAHAASCEACGAAVERARSLGAALEALADAFPGADLAARVTRLRAFSRRERRTYALWRAPVGVSAVLGLAGLALVAVPGLSAGDQAGLAAAALVPLGALFRSAVRWLPDLARVAPSGLDALSTALAAQRSLGLGALLLLAPAIFGLSRVFVRARSHR